MAIAYRSGSVVTGITAQTDTLAFSVPIGAQVGDLAIVSMITSQTGDTMTTVPSGWTLLVPGSGTNPATVGTALALWFYWKVLGSGDLSGTKTWVLSTSRRPCGLMDLFSGVDPTTPIEASVTDALASSTSQPADAVISLSPNAWIYNIWSARQGSGGPSTIAVPGSHTARGYAATNFASSGVNTAIRSGNLTTPGAAGSYGPYTATLAPAGNAGVASFALRPAVKKSSNFLMIGN